MFLVKKTEPSVKLTVLLVRSAFLFWHKAVVSCQE